METEFVKILKYKNYNGEWRALKVGKDGVKDITLPDGNGFVLISYENTSKYVKGHRELIKSPYMYMTFAETKENFFRI